MAFCRFMKTKTSILMAALAAWSAAEAEIAGYPDGPKLPGVPYSVHDPARPQPAVVTTGGAISVKPPSDAVVLFDGSSLDAWTPGWKIQNGAMVATSNNIQSR